MSDKMVLMEALGGIDDRHLQRYFAVNEKQTNSRTVFQRKKWIALTAACMSVILVVTAIIVFANHTQSPNTPGVQTALPNTTDEPFTPDETTPVSSTIGNHTTDKGLMIAPDADDPEGAVKIAVTTNKAVIKAGEALSVSVYAMTGSEIDYQQEPVPVNVTAKISMSYARVDPWFNKEVIKEISDGTKKDYTWYGSYDTMKAEEITVPADVFTEKEETDGKTGEKFSANEGAIVWFLEVHKEFSNGETDDERSGAALYYRIVGEDVFLYATQYDFKNDIRTESGG